MSNIPIQFLNGVGEFPFDGFGSAVTDIITGKDLEGLGLGSTEDDSAKIYDYLVKTRNIIASRPDMVQTVQNPAEMLKMYDYAIKYWNTPKRDEALAILEKEEDKLIKSGKILMGLDQQELSGIDGTFYGFWKSVKNGVKKTGQNAKGFILKFNPISIVARTGFLIALKINMNHLSSKLAPGYLSPADAQKEGISPARHQQAVEALKKVKHMFIDQMKGESLKLKKAILSGKRRKWRKKIVLKPEDIEVDVKANQAEANNLDGIGSVTVAAGAGAVATATPFIIKATQYIKDLFVNEEKQQYLKEAMETQGMTKSEAKKSYAAVKKGEKKPGATFDKFTNIVQQTGKSAANYTQPKNIHSEPESESQTTTNMPVENPEPGGIKKYLTPQTFIIAGGLIGLAFLASRLFTPKPKQMPIQAARQVALSGVKKGHARKSPKPATKRVQTKKVKTVKLH